MDSAHLKRKKVMVVDEELAEMIENLSKKMKTSTKDVLYTATSVLKIALGRRVIMEEPGDSTHRVEIDEFKDLDPAVRYTSDKNE